MTAAWVTSRDLRGAGGAKANSTGQIFSGKFVFIKRYLVTALATFQLSGIKTKNSCEKMPSGDLTHGAPPNSGAKVGQEDAFLRDPFSTWTITKNIGSHSFNLRISFFGMEVKGLSTSLTFLPGRRFWLKELSRMFQRNYGSQIDA